LRKGWIAGSAVDREARSAALCVVAVPESAAMSAQVRSFLAVVDRSTVVTDVFSSKGDATKAIQGFCRARGLRFGWSHPLAGREGSGAASADARVFDGATVVIDSKSSSDVKAALERLWRSQGCRIERMSTREHQKSMGHGSHLMHAVAFALSKVVARGGGRPSPSVMGATRVASSKPEAWSEILVSNRRETVKALASLERELKGVAKLLREKKVTHLVRYLATGRRARLELQKQVEGRGSSS
jgi:prephenate dehydrogenase